MDFVLVTLWGLAVWRVSLMINKERGPLDIFARLRAFLASKQKRMGGVYDMVSCFQCLSVWVAAIPALFLADSVLLFVGYTLTMSAVAIVLTLVLDRGK